MGSVIDEIECPHCKQQAMQDYYYKTDERYVTCLNCGYYHAVSLKNRDKSMSEVTDEDYEEFEVKEPYASYRIKPKGTIFSHVGSLSSEEEFEDLKSKINYDEVESFSISQFKDGEIIKTIIYEDVDDESDDK